MRLSFYGGAGMVTGVNYLLECGKTKILIDCGLFQGSRTLEEKNFQPFLFNPREIDFVLITHAHLDHIGRLPKLIEEGFQGFVFATEPTVDLAYLMLKDSCKILSQKANREGVIPLVSDYWVEKIMSRFKKVTYGEKIKLKKGVSVCFKNAGHVLGSAFIEIESEGKKIVFSGDLGGGHLSLLEKPYSAEKADYFIIESAYGNRLHEPGEVGKEIIEDVVEETVSQQGVLMIPSFALERTQELLYHFNELVEHYRVPSINVFLDSPLAINLTEVYRKYQHYFSPQAQNLIKKGDDIFNFPGLKITLSVKESKTINNFPPPKVIIAGSGMSHGGRIIHHEVRYLSQPENTLLLVTYQAKGTLGRRILEGASEVEILDQLVPVRAKVKYISCYSSHADQKDLLEWIKNSFISFKSGFRQVSQRPKKVFVCQGEKEAAESLAQKIKDELCISAKVPSLGESVNL